ncbi:FTR1 family protein [Bhargavaea ullalensis]|uniref:High-affinity iron transporter n=1 Tax=Bhargavaea ullalensis TaxID=1265685 RepID=A0ABV2G9S7_9BACL
MKAYLHPFKLLLPALALLLFMAPLVHAAPNVGPLYISITDAILSTKKGEPAKAAEALEKFAHDWSALGLESGKETDHIEQALDRALNSKNDEDRLASLSELSKSLTAYEQAGKPDEEESERQAFFEAVSPAVKEIGQAIDQNDPAAVRQAYDRFSSKWTRNERTVREYDVAAYGQIETRMAFIRVALAEDEPDLNTLQSEYAGLEQSIRNFSDGTAAAPARANVASIDTLLALLEKSEQQIKEGNPSGASDALKEFIVVWPSVEGEIRTKNAGLYSKIETDIPRLAGALTRPSADTDAVLHDVDQLHQQIGYLQEKTNYTAWDAATILLREGLEALLIISALIAFLKKAGQTRFNKYIYAGAGAGILASIGAAVLMSTLLYSSTIGTSRELMEGWVGLIAAAMMLGVGVWLHGKSSADAWNRYISKQMDHALSSQSIWVMASISFLTVFREGAETMVFYAGLAPNMPASRFLFGIGIALAILVAVAVLFMKASHKLPMHLFFGAASLLIYLLAFKIVGASIHTLQLTNVLPSHFIAGMPASSLIGLYPSIEPVAAQVLLIGLIAAASLYKKRTTARTAASEA